MEHLVEHQMEHLVEHQMEHPVEHPVESAGMGWVDRLGWEMVAAHEFDVIISRSNGQKLCLITEEQCYRCPGRGASEVETGCGVGFGRGRACDTEIKFGMGGG